MRITVVNEGFDPRRGGAEQNAARLADALTARGHEVARLARDARRGRVSGALSLARQAERARDEAGVVVSLCKAPGDVLFPQEGVHIAAVAGSLARHGVVTRSVLAVGKLLSPKQWAFLAAEGASEFGPGARRPARRYIALSRRIRDDMIRLWNAPAEAVEVAPNGVDCDRFAPASADRRAAARAKTGAREDEIVVLFVSNHYALRGLEQLIHAIAVAHGPYRLLVAGRGDAEPHARLAAALGVRADFAGEVDDVRPLLAAADIFALPTFYDTCSLSTLEALAAGLPVITSRANGAAELFSGREGAVIENARRIGSIGAALARLRDPGRRADCGAAARETALAHPLDRAVRRVVEIVESAATP